MIDEHVTRAGDRKTTTAQSRNELLIPLLDFTMCFHCEFIHLARALARNRLLEGDWAQQHSAKHELTSSFFQSFQISFNRYIQLKRSLIKMKSLVIAFVICLSCGAYGEDVKPAKAIAALMLSDKVFGSM